MARSSGCEPAMRRLLLPHIYAPFRAAIRHTSAIFPGSTLRMLLAAAQLVVKPRPGERPSAIRGPASDPQCVRSLRQRQAREESELDQFRAERVVLCQLLD